MGIRSAGGDQLDYELQTAVVGVIHQCSQDVRWAIDTVSTSDPAVAKRIALCCF